MKIGSILNNEQFVKSLVSFEKLEYTNRTLGQSSQITLKVKFQFNYLLSVSDYCLSICFFHFHSPGMCVVAQSLRDFAEFPKVPVERLVDEDDEVIHL